MMHSGASGSGAIHNLGPGAKLNIGAGEIQHFRVDIVVRLQ